jgi:hypothetical protein
MLNRVLWSTAFASTAFLAFAGEAFAATDKVKVGVGTFLVALVAMSVLFLVFLIKYYFGLAGVIPAPVEDDGHSSYPSLPADAHGAEAATSHH